MTATPTWSGVTIDDTLLAGYGYNETIVVNGESYIRYIGYMAAGIAEARNQVVEAAASFTTSSSTSLTIAAGTHFLTVDIAKAFAAGMIVTVAADNSNYMVCVVTGYTLAGAMTVTTLDLVGAGTYASWTIALSGRRGSTGPQGVAGASGANGVDGATGASGSGTTMNADQDGLLVTVTPRPLVNFQFSIKVTDNSGAGRFDVKLDGDAATPGNTYYYGTNGAGTKGFYNLTTTVATLVPFASNSDVTTGTSTTKAMVPANAASIIAGRISKFTRFTSTGTFTKDARTVAMHVSVIGGGQSGTPGSDVIAAGASGQGGHGGEEHDVWLAAADVGASVAVTIGAGGATLVYPGTFTSTGNAGGTTTFGHYAVARGGSGSNFVVNPLTIGLSGNGGTGGNGLSGTSGAAGYFIGDSTNGVAGADGVPGAGNSGATSGAITAGAATNAVSRRAGGPGGGGALQNGTSGTSVGGAGGNGASAGGGGGGGGGAWSSSGLSSACSPGSGGAGGNGECTVLEIFGA